MSISPPPDLSDPRFCPGLFSPSLFSTDCLAPGLGLSPDLPQPTAKAKNIVNIKISNFLIFIHLRKIRSFYSSNFLFFRMVAISALFVPNAEIYTSNQYFY